MTYQYNEIVSAKALSDLRESVGWNRMENEYESPLMTSFYHIAVYENRKLVGYVDCVSNGVTDAYIQDLMVHPDYQGKGIGTDLMNQMIRYLKEKRIYMVSVVFEERLKPFYDKFGFNQMLCGQMETFTSK
ncbi:MAG: GNAT family N-acetyltransferase [Lachnospiraceae bacterium]|nr:GNAT family N-acetyltransferase [Lachnospiraceae bacterium]